MSKPNTILRRFSTRFEIGLVSAPWSGFTARPNKSVARTLNRWLFVRLGKVLSKGSRVATVRVMNGYSNLSSFFPRALLSMRCAKGQASLGIPPEINARWTKEVGQCLAAYTD